MNRTISFALLASLNIQPDEVRFAPSDPHGDRRYTFLATDSRNIDNAEQTVFAALRTVVNTGNRYISELYRRGVTAFIVDEIPDEARNFDAAFIVVPDVAAALRQMAYARIRGFQNGIAVTGSIGKTITKELIYRALKPYCDVQCSTRSWNSSIGVALSLWQMTVPEKMPDYIITEAAIDGPGQAQAIYRCLANSHNITVITPITDEHDEAFASHADKIAEKLRLITGNIIIYADTDPELKRALEDYADTVGCRKLIAVPQPAEGDAMPTIYHALAAKALEVAGAPKQAVEAVPSLPLAETRRQIFEGAFGNTVVRDAFTPDMRSLADSLRFFGRHTSRRRNRALITGRLLDKASRAEIEALAGAHGINTVLTAAETENSSQLHGVESGADLRNSDILVFGDACDPSLMPYVEALESADHDTTMQVDLDALIHNYNYYRRLLPGGTGIIGMVKASAYGMGDVEIARTLQDHGAAYLAVAVVDEGVKLREAGITMPIVVLNPITKHHYNLFTHNLEPSVFSPEELHTLLDEAARHGHGPFPVHIKIDTGMHRVGFTEEQIEQLTDTLAGQNRLVAASVFTHLSSADCPELDHYTHNQIDTFVRVCDRIDSALGYSPKRHFLNTAGMMRFASAARYDLARPGIGLYGIAPYTCTEASRLKPVASLSTRIISLKHWPADTPVGYGCKGRTTRPSIIATIPVGYADGINRHLGRGHASFYVKGVPCPTIGNICMDQCMIDVTEVPDVVTGDAVEIFGPHQRVEVLSDVLDTIPYEIITSVSPRVKRTYSKR